MVLAMAVFLPLALVIEPRDPPELDEAILEWIGLRLRGPVGTFLVQVYRLSGVGFTGILVAVSIVFLLLKRWWNDLRLVVLASGGILALVDMVLKPFFYRARPSDKLLEVTGRSFPSGHAAGSIAFYFAMVTILALHYPRLRRPLTIAVCLWIALVWLSTLYTRAHWPSDLIAGGAVGLVWLILCLGVWRGSAAAGSERRPSL
jgi:undecaprenyl-diphosphatase